MAIDAYINFTNSKQAPRKGESSSFGKSVLHSYNFGVVAPRDASSGMMSGKRTHQPVTIRKEVDQASPSLYQAMLSKKPLECQIELYKTGHTRPNYSLQLSGGVVSGIRHGSSTAKGRGSFEYEEVNFVFQQIEVTWNDGGISAKDDWNAPV